MSDELEAADEHAEVVRAEMLRQSDAQLVRAERLRASARQTFIFLSGVFTVAQAVAFSSFAADAVSKSQQRVVIVLAVSAALATAVSGILALCVERLKVVPDASPADLIEQADKATDGFPIQDRMIALHYATANQRIDALEGKRKFLTALNWTAIAGMLLVLTEVGFSLIARWP